MPNTRRPSPTPRLRPQTKKSLKSRAQQTTITNSRFVDGPDSQASYSIDLPDGGLAVLHGNQISKGPQSPNRYIVHYGGEAVPTWPGSSLDMVGNIVVNQRGDGATGVFNQSRDGPSGVANPATITGNTFYEVQAIHQTVFGPSLPTLADNTMLAGPGPAISSAHPFVFGAVAVLEPGTATLLATALVARVLAAKVTAFRRRRSARLTG